MCRATARAKKSVSNKSLPQGNVKDKTQKSNEFNTTKEEEGLSSRLSSWSCGDVNGKDDAVVVVIALLLLSS